MTTTTMARINRDEVITAIGDYLFSAAALTRDQVIALIGLYLFG